MHVFRSLQFLILTKSQVGFYLVGHGNALVWKDFTYTYMQHQTNIDIFVKCLNCQKCPDGNND